MRNAPPAELCVGVKLTILGNLSRLDLPALSVELVPAEQWLSNSSFGVQLCPVTALYHHASVHLACPTVSSPGSVFVQGSIPFLHTFPVYTAECLTDNDNNLIYIWEGAVTGGGEGGWRWGGGRGVGSEGVLYCCQGEQSLGWDGGGGGVGDGGESGGVESPDILRGVASCLVVD